MPSKTKYVKINSKARTWLQIALNDDKESLEKKVLKFAFFYYYVFILI